MANVRDLVVEISERRQRLDQTFFDHLRRMRRQHGDRAVDQALARRSGGFVDPSRRSISEKDSDPTRQGHTARPPGGLHQKSTLAQPHSLIKRGAGNPAECDIAQTSQIALAQIPLHPGSLQLACKFDHKGQSAEEQGNKHEFNLHANHRHQIGEHRMNTLKGLVSEVLLCSISRRPTRTLPIRWRRHELRGRPTLLDGHNGKKSRINFRAHLSRRTCLVCSSILFGPSRF
jgi:hypothetical protein